jgi:hypothetical protein
MSSFRTEHSGQAAWSIQLENILCWKIIYGFRNFRMESNCHNPKFATRAKLQAAPEAFQSCDIILFLVA